MAALDLDALIENLWAEKKLLTEAEVTQVTTRLKEILAAESNVHHIDAPVVVVGDVHGQYHDVLEIFRIAGRCPDTNYLFLGDYVDRGHYSVETITLLACLKLRWPHRITLLRGNHESRSVYGFYAECMRKYGSPTVWTLFTDMFDFLTLSVVVGNEIFCTHGGLSPAIVHLDQIRILNRFQEIPHEGAIADLVWSDPGSEHETFTMSPRGAGFTYGKAAVNQFLHLNKMSHILRAHQLCMEGFQVLFDDTVSTVWSAPNYCYRCGNMASILQIDSSLSRFFNIFGPAPEHSEEVHSSGNAKSTQYFL